MAQINIRFRTKINAHTKPIIANNYFIKFSATSDGQEFTDTWSQGQEYIGFALSMVEPISPRDYVWAKFIGTDSQAAQEYAELARQSAINAGQNKTAAEEIFRATVLEKNAAQLSASNAAQSEAQAVSYSRVAKGYSNAAKDYSEGARVSKQLSQDNANQTASDKQSVINIKQKVEQLSSQAESFADQAEAYSVGTNKGSPLTPENPAYNNNAKGYAKQAQDAADLVENLIEEHQVEIEYVALLDGGSATSTP